MTETGSKLFLRRSDERFIQFLLHQVDGAAAEAAAHDTRTRHIHLAGQLVQEIQFLAAYLVQLAHAEMGLIHHLTHGLVVSALEGIADIQHTLNLADNVLRPQEILLRNLLADLVQPLALCIAQEFNFGMIFADSRRCVFTGSAALVVGARCQFVLDAGINQHQLVPLRIEGEVFVLQRLAVETDQATGLAEQGGELVHDATLDPAVVVFRGLADLGQLELVDTVVEQVVQGKSESAFQGCRRGEAGAQRDVTRENRAETMHLATALDHLPAHPEQIAGPALVGLVFLVQAKFAILVMMHRICLDLLRSVHHDFRHNTLIDGSREHIATIVVRVLANQIHASGRCENGTVLSEQGPEFFLDFFFHFHIETLFMKFNHVYFTNIIISIIYSIPLSAKRNASLLDLVQRKGGVAEAEVDGPVIGNAAVVAGADVGAAGFLAAVGFVALGQKGRMEDGHPCGGARRSETRRSRSGNVGKEEKVDQLPAPVEADGALAACRQRERQVLQGIQALKQRSIGRVVEIARGDNPAPAGSPEGIAELAETVHRRLAPPCR